MHAFYFKALLRLMLLLFASIVAAYGCLKLSYHEELLLTPVRDGVSWVVSTRADEYKQGSSVVRSTATPSRLTMDFTLDRKIGEPFVATFVQFIDAQGKRKLADLSKYSRIGFEARCFPATALVFTLNTFDPRISRHGTPVTYRSPEAFFDCDEAGKRHELDLRHLTIPRWWLDLFKVNLADQGYALDKVVQLEFGTTGRSQAGVPSRVEIVNLSLHRREYAYLYGLGAGLLLAWAGFLFWFFRSYAAALLNDVQARMQKDMPLVAYQQLSLEPHRDKEKGSVLKLLATRYADAQLDLDTVVAETGVNRNKVNDILKAELGYTFTGYLNKLRLTEAARLLRETQASIAEVAYSVGYNNASYFNKLFKEEYQCTPKAFRDVCNKSAADTAPSPVTSLES